jgi:hypothetical protein
MKRPDGMPADNTRDNTSCSQNVSLLALHAGNDVCPEDASRLRRHLEDCADCRLLLAEFRATRDWLRSNAAPPVDGDLLDELRGRVVRRLARERPFPWLLALLGRSWASWRTGLGWQSVRGMAVATLLLVGALGALPSLDGRRVQRSWRATEPTTTLPIRAAMVPTGEPAGESGEEEDSSALESEQEELAESESGGGALDGGIEEPSGDPSGLRIEMQTTDPNVRIIWFASNTEGQPQ